MSSGPWCVSCWYQAASPAGTGQHFVDAPFQVNGYSLCPACALVAVPIFTTAAQRALFAAALRPPRVTPAP
jgi:hypothetical protein